MTLGARIAVVDDDPRIRRLLEEDLKDEGFEPICFSDGFLLLQELNNQSVDLVLMDLMMPQLDGIECLRRLRASGFNAPILIFTALSDNDKRTEAELEGANGYILKPDLFDNPAKIVRSHLKA